MMILEPNYKEAFKWIEILVKKGSLSAKYDMGVCYFYGRGVPEDKSKAVEIWKSILEEVVEESNYIRNKVVLSMNVIIKDWALKKTKKNLK